MTLKYRLTLTQCIVGNKMAALTRGKRTVSKKYQIYYHFVIHFAFLRDFLNNTRNINVDILSAYKCGFFRKKIQCLNLGHGIPPYFRPLAPIFLPLCRTSPHFKLKKVILTKLGCP